MAAALEIVGLRKAFHRTVAVRDLSMTVEPGQLVGLIGPNGAGKSTTVKVVTGQLLADAGLVKVGGFDVVTHAGVARAKTGYVPQKTELYPFLTGREVLRFVADVRGLDKADSDDAMDELLDRFRLTDAQHRMTREYSEGMARKLAISAALLGDPALLVLDESLTGLDPRAAAEVKAVVQERLQRGTAVLLVSHLLAALERLCDSVVLIDHGQVMSTLAPQELTRMRESGLSLEDHFLEHTERQHPAAH